MSPRGPAPASVSGCPAPWALASGIGPILRQVALTWARLGPFSIRRALRSASFPTRRQLFRPAPAYTYGSRRFVAPALAQQGGVAVSRLDGRGLSLECRLLFRDSSIRTR